MNVSPKKDLVPSEKKHYYAAQKVMGALSREAEQAGCASIQRLSAVESDAVFERAFLALVEKVSRVKKGWGQRRLAELTCSTLYNDILAFEKASKVE